MRKCLLLAHELKDERLKSWAKIFLNQRAGLVAACLWG